MGSSRGGLWESDGLSERSTATSTVETMESEGGLVGAGEPVLQQVPRWLGRQLTQNLLVLMQAQPLPEVYPQVLRWSGQEVGVVITGVN